MKRRAKLALGTLAALVIAGAIAVSSARGAHDDEGPATVAVERGDIVDRALAVGTIEPETQVGVKSKVSGVVSRLFAEPGDYVEAGAALLEIRPDPTPLELVEARRQLEQEQVALDNLTREWERQQALAERGLIARQELEAKEQEHAQAKLRLRSARDRLQLLETGHIRGGAGQTVESVVRAPISGYVLEKMVEVGDPVVPLSSYQEGTVLMTMADMSRLVFEGTVDEIDVGRLAEGMPAEIKIGALPETAVRGEVARISLIARTEESATSFPVEIALTETGGATLRAGFSANADVIIQERTGVLRIPERVVTWEDDGTAWVQVLGADGTPERRAIRTGLSDAIQVEVLDGLEQGEQVLEKPEQSV